MSLQDYSLSWSPGLVARVETHLRDIHSAIHQYYEKEGYPTRVEDRGTGAVGGSSGGGDPAADDAASVPVQEGAMDVVSPAGSFLHRTCVHAVPLPSLHAERGVGADLVITMPVEVCGQAELQDGSYLLRRQQFVEQVGAYLEKLVQGAAAKVAAAAVKRKKSRRGAAGDGDASGEEEEDNDGERNGGEKGAANLAAAERLSRMIVTRMPIHGCYANGEKEMVRLRFSRRPGADDQDDGFHQHLAYEVFYVDLHFRPAQSSGRVMSAAAARKHPYYSYLVLEDYLMPFYLKKIHSMCVEAGGLRRALVILKCWAHHVGLMASASGHPEGLNGFLLACMLLKLREDGILSNTTSEENAARTLWIRLAHGYFLTPATAGTKVGSAHGHMAVPAAEERGEVAVLRLSGEVMNLLFRSSSGFFRNVVQRAAEEALVHAVASDVLAQTPFQPMQLRYDVALTITNALPTPDGEVDLSTGGGALRWDTAALRKPSVHMSPTLLQAQERCTATLTTALGHRASFLSTWPTSANTLHVIVQLTTEAEGRNHLTRGPPIEDAEAVAAFNAFWGADATSTRQFPDGAIYRCVLWRFPEVVGTRAMAVLPATTVVRRIAEFALRRHAAASTRVSVFLGGLEGFLAERVGAEWRDGAQVMQRSLQEASLEVQRAIADLPRTVLPCKITEFCVIGASERGTEVFPVRPHFALTRTTDDLAEECFTGLSTAPSIEPIHCVMAIDDKGKIPDTLEAIGLMKGAIAAQLTKYMHQRYGRRGDAAKTQARAGGTEDGAQANTTTTPMEAFASPQSVDLICQGYLFRVHIAHYREVSLLRALQREPEANLLERKLFWSVQHAKLIRSIVYGHHSYANAVRLATRWVGAMLLHDFIAPEAIELLVANAYLSEVGTSTSTATTGSTSTVAGAPRTSAGGFIRFIQLLATHDWRRPLILPFTDDDKDPSTAARKLLRRPGEHQAIYIATPYAPTESPFTLNTPRPMILHRLVQLAKGVLALLVEHLGAGLLGPGVEGEADGGEGAVSAACAVERAMFSSDPRAFDFAMAFHPQLILQPDRDITVRDTAATLASAELGGGSSTGAAASKSIVRIRQLDELDRNQSREYVSALVEREPAAYAVRSIRAALRDQGMVFYDALAPTSLYVVGVTGTPVAAKSMAMHEEILRVGRGAVLPAPPLAFARAGGTAPRAARRPTQTQPQTQTRQKPQPTSRPAGATPHEGRSRAHGKRGPTPATAERKGTDKVVSEAVAKRPRTESAAAEGKRRAPARAAAKAGAKKKA